LAIQSVFPQTPDKLLQGQPAKKKNKKICLTQLFYPRPRRGTPPSLTASRKALNLLTKLIQTCAEKIRRKTGLKGAGKTMLALTRTATKVVGPTKNPAQRPGFLRSIW
jgi:hypothetical protein